LNNSIAIEKLGTRACSISLEKVIENSKAESGGKRDVDFLKFLIGNNLLVFSETILRRSQPNIVEEYYLERYKKFNLESDKHFLCRTVIQDELKKLGISTKSGKEAGNMDILRSNCNYDIVSSDLSTLIDIGLTPARNFFKGLSDLKVKAYLIAAYFDDYIDEVIFSVFTRSNDEYYLNAIRDYEEKFKLYTHGTEFINNGLTINNISELND